ncbi:integrase, catalytic region, zinc finger, CCHC-type containing protein, partial [Tanacetum coccineum]
NGVTKTKKYEELSATEKIQADYDLNATNIILQGLPSDVYSHVNRHRVAKDLWKIVQLLMQGESLHQYYLRFTQLINDINIYKMKLEQFQVHTKLLNSLPPEWSKFMTDVKLVRDLHTTNFDKLHAYLEQHELHANEVCIMRECNQDPLSLVANHQMTPLDFNTYQSSYNNPQFQQQFSPSQSPQYGSIHPTQHYLTTYPSTPHAINYPSTPHPNAYSSTIHQDANPQPQFIPQIKYIISTVNQQTHLAEFPQIDSGLAVSVFKQGDDPIDAINKMMSFLSTVVSISFRYYQQSAKKFFQPKTISQQRVVKCFNCQGEGHMARQCLKPKRKRDATWFRDKVLLVEAQGSGKVLNEEELEFLVDPGVAEAKTILMANLSNYGSDFLSELFRIYKFFCTTRCHDIICVEQLSNQVTNCNKANKDNLITNKSLSAELERYKERVELLEERQNMDLSTREKLIIDDVIREKNAQFADLDKEINFRKQTLSDQLKEKESLTKTFTVFKNESKEKEAKNIDKEIALEKKVKELDNILNRLSKDFGKRFVPQQELSDEQAFRLQTSHPNTNQSAYLHVKIEAPQELLKLAMQLNKEIFQKNNTFVKQTEPSFDQLFELNNLKDELQAKDITIKKLKANIKRLNKTSTTNNVKKDIDEIETINIELEHTVTKLIAENEHLK